jgi:phage-related protein
MTALPDIEMSYGTDMTEEYRVRRIDFGDGYSQRGMDGLNTQRQEWRVSWNGIREADAEVLRLFFRGLAGVGVIEWTPFNQTDELKWTASGFGSKPSGATTFDCGVTLTQEFDL